MIGVLILLGSALLQRPIRGSRASSGFALPPSDDCSGYFQGTGYLGREQQANMSLVNTDSNSCTTTAPDMSQPDTSNQDFGLIYGGPNPPPGS